MDCWPEYVDDIERKISTDTVCDDQLIRQKNDERVIRREV